MELKTKNKKILITGGTGFQGSNLSRKLLDSGFDVTILNTYSEKNELNIKRFNLQQATIIWGDINDKQMVEKATRDVELIIHTAAKIHVDDSIKNPTEYFRTNVMGTNNILEVAREFDISVLHISTCEVYGFIDEDLYETSPLMPRSPYAASKAAADRMAYSYYTTYGMNICIVRPFNVYGPGQRDGDCGAVIPRWTTSLMNGDNIKIYGDGKQSREFIYIDDLISAYEIIINKMLSSTELSGEVINIGTNVDVNIKYLAEELCNKINNSNYNKITYGGARPGEVKRFISNSDKMKSFNWHPLVNLSDGLSKYLEWRRSLDSIETCLSNNQKYIK
jgi:dTDP-glucose 4,6-dehydratase